MQNIIVIIGLCLLAGLGYYLFVVEDSSLSEQEQLLQSQAATEAATFKRRLSELQRIDLRTDVLDDERFTNRIDNARPVPSVAAGRSNPFVLTTGVRATSAAPVSTSTAP